MNGGETGAEPVAVSGSAVARLRREALEGLDGTAILLFDSSLLVRLMTGNVPGGADAALVGAPLTDAVDSAADATRIERAARRALAGGELQITLESVEGQRSMRFAPVEGRIDGGKTALVAISADQPDGAEVDELRARASDLESLAAATGALSRGTGRSEVRSTACAAAADVAGAELAALLEPRPDGTALVITASHGFDMHGREVSLNGPSIAVRVFNTGESSFCADLARQRLTTAWPLHEAGAVSALWLPVKRSVGVRGVIAVGWKDRVERPGKRATGLLQQLAGEAAVAIDRAAALERLTGLARTDPLTELSNRRAWQDELSKELARAGRTGQRLSIGLIDLDELKSFNDRWGHAAGDKVLLTAAVRWGRRLRLTDLLARVGGDEFAVTMPGCTLSEAAALGDQLRETLPDGLSCSVGVAEWVEGEPVESLLARADRALYAAKNAGRNRTFGTPAPS